MHVRVVYECGGMCVGVWMGGFVHLYLSVCLYVSVCLSVCVGVLHNI